MKPHQTIYVIVTINAGVAGAGWVEGPQERGSLQVISSCLIALLLGAVSVVHRIEASAQRSKWCVPTA